MIFDIFLIIVSVITSLIGFSILLFNREHFGNKLNVLLNGSIYLFLGILFFTFFFLSTEIYFSEDNALFFWNFSIFFWTVSISILSLNHRFLINFEKKAVLSMFLYSLFIGIILGLTSVPNSFIINLSYGFYIFNFQNVILLFFIIIYNLIIIGVMCYNIVRFFSSVRDKRSKKVLALLTLEFVGIIILYSICILLQNLTIRYFWCIFYLIGAIFSSYYLVKKPFMFIELTNKIYDFIIFHRSGILLYSYNFNTGKETDDSLLKGSILIGINHILSNFINKKDQLSLIKMQNRDIIFEYDISHGYALLLTTNHKNSFIDNAVSKFMKKFTRLNQEKLKNLTGLIDASEFKNAKELILEFFEPFIIKN